jgi:hypothetical protein
MHHPTRLLTIGFAIIILLMIALSYMGFQSINGGGSKLNLQVAGQLQKINLINELSTIIQNRTRFFQSMLLRDKEFIESESWPTFSRMSGAYAATRERLEPMLAPREREVMRAIDHLDKDISDLNRQVSVFAYEFCHRRTRPFGPHPLGRPTLTVPKGLRITRRTCSMSEP